MTVEAAEQRPGRIPSLDGLRALSIALVLFGHVIQTHGFPRQTWLSLVGDVANLGVRIFFVISGFLITGLLLGEQARCGSISLRDFYLRRFFRIFPAFYTYIAVIVALAAAGVVALRPWDTLTALTYTVNYHHDRSWYLGHIWSLSVEEQFYLLWPPLVVLLGRRAAPWLAAAVLVAAPLSRVVSLAVPALRPGLGETFLTVADAIAAGCLLALVRDRLWSAPRWRALVASPLFLLAPLLAFGANLLPLRYDLTVGQTFMNLALAAFVERVVRLPDGPLGRALNWAPIAFVGTLSYSIYLWQQPFLNKYADGAIQSFPLNLLFVVLAALASYFLVERPMLGVRRRLERRRELPVADAVLSSRA